MANTFDEPTCDETFDEIVAKLSNNQEANDEFIKSKIAKYEGAYEEATKLRHNREACKLYNIHLDPAGSQEAQNDLPVLKKVLVHININRHTVPVSCEVKKKMGDIIFTLEELL